MKVQDSTPIADPPTMEGPTNLSIEQNSISTGFVAVRSSTLSLEDQSPTEQDPPNVQGSLSIDPSVASTYTPSIQAITYGSSTAHEAIELSDDIVIRDIDSEPRRY